MRPQDYHVIILAAGNSTRLRHLTKTQPKCFLEVHGKKLLEKILEDLALRGFKNISIVVGYLKEMIINHFGARFKNMDIDYVTSADYEVTGHGWSLLLTEKRWALSKSPVLLIHADLYCDPLILDKVISSPEENLICIEKNYNIDSQDEQLVWLSDQHVSSIQKFQIGQTNAAGEVVGINKWSSTFMSEYFDFSKTFFGTKGSNYNWEPVLNEMIRAKLPLASRMKTISCDGLSWVNINYEKDLVAAQKMDTFAHA